MSDWDEVTQTGVGDLPCPPERTRRTAAYFVVITGPGVGTMHKLPDEGALIGRGQAAQIRLLEDGVSRAHARVRSFDRHLMVEDLGSRNGTFVNGKRVDRPHALTDGDKVQIGRATVLRFSYHDSLDETFHEQMLQSALRDSTTKLYNKRYFLDRLDGELKFARRHGSALSVLLADLDHFKQVNDRHGHVAGDAVLANVAAVIGKSVRNEDVVARFGGEEIAVILRAIGLTAAMALAERLRKVVESSRTVLEDGRQIAVTISLGVASVPEQELESVTELLEAADQALYRAKRGGRNRIER